MNKRFLDNCHALSLTSCHFVFRQVLRYSRDDLLHFLPIFTTSLFCSTKIHPTKVLKLPPTYDKSTSAHLLRLLPSSIKFNLTILSVCETKFFLSYLQTSSTLSHKSFFLDHYHQHIFLSLSLLDSNNKNHFKL